MTKFAWVAPFLLALNASAASPTVQDAKKFLEDAESKLLVLGTEAGHADWLRENFINFDSETLSATVDERAIAEGVRLAKGATRFDHLKLPPDMTRKMMLLKNGLTLAAPADPNESAEVTRLAASLDGAYGKGKSGVIRGFVERGVQVALEKKVITPRNAGDF